MLYDRAIVIQRAKAIKAENCPGPEGEKVPSTEVVNACAIKIQDCTTK